MSSTELLGAVVETRAYLDGLAAIAAAAEGQVQIDAFDLLQLIEPARSKLKGIEQQLTEGTPSKLCSVR